MIKNDADTYRLYEQHVENIVGRCYLIHIPKEYKARYDKNGQYIRFQIHYIMACQPSLVFQYRSQPCRTTVVKQIN